MTQPIEANISSVESVVSVTAAMGSAGQALTPTQSSSIRLSRGYTGGPIEYKVGAAAWVQLDRNEAIDLSVDLSVTTIMVRKATTTSAAIRLHLKVNTIISTGPTPGVPLAAAAPVTISGAPFVGSVLSASIAAGWQNTGGNWTRNGTAISGATNLTYTLVSADAPGPVTYKSSNIPYIPPGLTISVPTAAPAITTAPALTGGGAVGQAITLTLGTVTGSPTPTSTVSWRDAGGNELSTSASTFTPTATGQITVVQTAANGVGSPATRMSNTVTVSNVAAPVANFTASTVSGAIPLTVNFTDTSTGAPTEWEWEFFGLGWVQATTKNPSYTFREPGTYTVKMRAKNSGGQNEVVKTALITVTDKAYAARAATVSRFVEGVEDVMYQPNAERLVAAEGAVLLDMVAVTPTTLTNCTTDLYTPTRYAPNTAGRRLTSTAAGNFSAVFPVPGSPLFNADKNYILKMWLPDITGATGFTVRIGNNSFTSQTWQLSGAGIKRGWNTVVLVAPNDLVASKGIGTVLGDGTVNGYASFVGLSQLGTAQTGGMHNKTIADITVSLAGSTTQLPVGTTMIFDRLETASKVKPILSITFDQVIQTSDGKEIFTELIIPMMKKYGFVGDARVHQEATSYNVPFALAAGFGLNNGTLTRLVNVTTKDQGVSEYGTINDKLIAAGYPVPEFGAAPGHNNGMDASYGIQALQQIGNPKFIRGNAQRAIYHGVQGHNGRGQLFGIFSIDKEQTNPAIQAAYIAGMKSFGGYGCFFSHTDFWSADRATFLEAVFSNLAAERDAGNIEVLPLSTGTTQRSMARALLGYM